MRARSTLIAGLALILAVTPSAEAQFGKITKKAQEAITKDAKPGCAPKFDDVVLELKEDALTRVVAGIRASHGLKGRGGMTPQEMMRRSAKASDERNALLEGRSNDLERYQESTNRHASCMNEALDRAREERSARLSQVITSSGVSDPQLIQDILRLTTKQQERLAAGDTAGARQAEAEMARRIGGDPQADTAKAIATCGRAPAKPAWLARADSLNEESNRLLAEARMLEQRADTLGAGTAGLGAQQFAVAEERVEAYVLSDGKPATVWCYSDVERTALGARMNELKELLD